MGNAGTGRILVVGAGTAGLTLALELARRGLVPMLVDAKDGPSTLNRAVGITPRSLAILGASGSAEPLVSEGQALRQMHIYRGKARAFSFNLHTSRFEHPTIVCLPQKRTEAILADRLRVLGGSITYGQQLAGITGKGPVTAQFANGSEARFDLVVGADGSSSTVRRASGIGWAGRDLDQMWSIRDVSAPVWRHPADITVVLEPGRLTAVVPLGHDRYRLVTNHAQAQPTPNLPIEITSLDAASDIPISVRQARAYAKGAIALAGDAALTCSPVGGRGMNMGIADAAALADCLARGRLADYGPMRRPAGRAVIRETEIARHLMTSESMIWRTAFSAMMGFGDLAGPLRRRVGRYAVEF